MIRGYQVQLIDARESRSDSNELNHGRLTANVHVRHIQDAVQRFRQRPSVPGDYRWISGSKTGCIENYPFPWAYRIATTVAIDFFRRTGKANFIEFNETDDCSDFDEDDRLVLDEMNECVRDIIDGLPPDYRAALILYNLQDKSVEETADICGVSVSTAKMRIHRAKARLQKALLEKCTFYKTDDGKLRCDKKPHKKEE